MIAFNCICLCMSYVMSNNVNVNCKVLGGNNCCHIYYFHYQHFQHSYVWNRISWGNIYWIKGKLFIKHIFVNSNTGIYLMTDYFILSWLKFGFIIVYFYIVYGYLKTKYFVNSFIIYLLLTKTKFQSIQNVLHVWYNNL